MNIITIGIDLAKNIFAVHGVNESGKAELVKPKVPRDLIKPPRCQRLPDVVTVDESRRIMELRTVTGADFMWRVFSMCCRQDFGARAISAFCIPTANA